LKTGQRRNEEQEAASETRDDGGIQSSIAAVYLLLRNRDTILQSLEEGSVPKTVTTVDYNYLPIRCKYCFETTHCIRDCSQHPGQRHTRSDPGPSNAPPLLPTPQISPNQQNLPGGNDWQAWLPRHKRKGYYSTDGGRQPPAPLTHQNRGQQPRSDYSPPRVAPASSATSAPTSVVYCDVTERNRVAMSRHRHNVTSRHYDGSRRCCYSGVN
jgi:hypothetical protein